MSEQQAQAEAAPVEAPQDNEVQEVQPETDWKAEARKWEARSKENKSAADRLSEIEEANKTEAERTAERLKVAEKAATDAQREALRFKIAAKHQITDEDAELFLTGTDEDTLTRQAERCAEMGAESKQPRSPRPDPNQGRFSTGQVDVPAGVPRMAQAFDDAMNTK